jgi:hypothetical protein
MSNYERVKRAIEEVYKRQSEGALTITLPTAALIDKCNEETDPIALLKLLAVSIGHPDCMVLRPVKYDENTGRPIKFNWKMSDPVREIRFLVHHEGRHDKETEKFIPEPKALLGGWRASLTAPVSKFILDIYEQKSSHQFVTASRRFIITQYNSSYNGGTVHMGLKLSEVFDLC